MKKLKYLLLLLLAIPFLVQAETKNVEITKVELVEKSDDVEELEEASFEGVKLNFYIKFINKDDFAKYKVVIKNNSNKDYEIDNSSIFNDKDFIKYEYELDSEDKVLKAKEEIVVYITITYYKEIDTSKFVDGKYIEKNNVSIEFTSNQEDEVIEEPIMRFATNPDTSTSDIIKIVVVLAIMSIVLAIVVNSKKGKVFLIALLLIIPLTAYALEKINLEVETYVMIEEPVETKVFYIAPDNIRNTEEVKDKVEYSFVEGMTWEDWLNSKYNVDKFNYVEGADFCATGDKYLIIKSKDGNNYTTKLVLKTETIIVDQIYFTGIGVQCIK